jgi:triphosphatase
MPRELEMKLIVDGALDVPTLLDRIRAHAEVGGGQQRVQRDVYLDSPELELRAAGLSARLRTVEGERRIEIKPVPIDPGLVMDRTEVTAEVPPDAEPGDVLRELVRTRLGLKIHGQPEPRLQLRTLRTRHTVRADGMQAELAIDDVQVQGASGFTEIELELEQGDAAGMVRLATTIAEFPGLSPSGRSKYERSLALAGFPEHTYSTPLPTFDRTWTAGEVARGVCAALHRTMRSYEPGTRVGLDPEQLHKMRVATRRLRTALRAFKHCFASSDHDLLNAEYRWLGRLLGEVRDLDVQLLALPSHAASFGPEPREGWRALEHELFARHDAARSRLVAGLDDPRYASLCALAQRVFEQPSKSSSESEAEAGRRPIVELAGHVLRKRVRAFQRAVSRFEATHGAVEAHDLRIVGKRLRYTGGFLAPLLGGDVRTRMSSLRAFQDRLGDIQDMVATGELARELSSEAFAASPPDAAYLFVLGQLTGAAATKAALLAPLVDRALADARVDTLLPSLYDALERDLAEP